MKHRKALSLCAFSKSEHVCRQLCAAFGVGVAILASAASASAAEFFEGVWAETADECLDKEGPNSRTFIDLSNKIEGKLVPLFDQYENHCKIKKTTPENKTSKLQVRCSEFWEDFEKDSGGADSTIVISQDSQNKIKIDGKSFVKCKD